mgnify:CR=1 FL=1
MSFFFHWKGDDKADGFDLLKQNSGKDFSREDKMDEMSGRRLLWEMNIVDNLHAPSKFVLTFVGYYFFYYEVWKETNFEILAIETEFEQEQKNMTISPVQGEGLCFVVFFKLGCFQLPFLSITFCLPPFVSNSLTWTH